MSRLRRTTRFVGKKRLRSIVDALEEDEPSSTSTEEGENEGEKRHMWQRGMHVWRSDHYRVKDTTDDDVIVESSTGQELAIHKPVFDAEMRDGYHFSNECSISRSDLVDVFLDIPPNQIFTVSFNKVHGETRVLVGKTEVQTRMAARGFVSVYDLEVYYDVEDRSKGQRLVNLRTLQWVIYDDIKFVC